MLQHVCGVDSTHRYSCLNTNARPPTRQRTPAAGGSAGPVTSGWKTLKASNRNPDRTRPPARPQCHPARRMLCLIHRPASAARAPRCTRALGRRLPRRLPRGAISEMLPGAAGALARPLRMHAVGAHPRRGRPRAIIWNLYSLTRLEGRMVVGGAGGPLADKGTARSPPRLGRHPEYRRPMARSSTYSDISSAPYTAPRQGRGGAWLRDLLCLAGQGGQRRARQARRQRGGSSNWAPLPRRWQVDDSEAA